MAVAAYSSVLALSRVVDNMRHPAHLRLFPDLTQTIDDLRQKLCFLQEFFEDRSSKITKDVLERVVRRIPRLARDTEILIDNFVVDQLQRELEDLQHDVDAEGSSRSVESFHGEITQVVQEIEQINESLQTLTTTAQHDQEQPRKSDDRPLTWSGGEEGKAVGFDDQVGQVLEKLAGNQTNLVIAPIVGMGGIGKTTLARSVFDHPYSSDRFPVRIWLTISQDYSVKKVLEALLNDGVLRDTKDGGGQSEAELITHLHQKLYGQRYLIVLDDVWSLEAWDDLRRGFPDNGNGSRVLVTTRLSEIATSLGSQNSSHSMKFLDEDKSWDLFSEKAFERGGQSLELEEIGRKISGRCRGLPLMLVVVGGLLANSDMTVQHWRDVEGNMNSVVSSANDEYCSRILSLSYKHMPIHLKACFLHMRHIEEDRKVYASDLIRKWVAQGFVKPMSGKSLEEAARKYLEDLISRNMIFVLERGRRSGNTRYCGMHDLLRELSITESDKEQLLELPKAVKLVLKESYVSCVICNDRKRPDDGNQHVTTVFSDGKMSVCGSCWSISPFARSRSVLAVELDSRRIPLLTTCRYIELDYSHGAVVLNTISLIWNLEFLAITNVVVVLPKELWEMPRLAHVYSPMLTLSDPASTENNVVVLENLQTLIEVSKFMFTEEIVRRIPNLRKLRVEYDHQSRRDWPSLYLQNLARLQKLEDLFVNCREASIDIEKYNFFPSSLKKLTLLGCEIVGWDSMTIIGSLPNLQVLILYKDSVLGDEWNPIEGEFLKLKVLSLDSLDLARWSADETHFPALEDLRLIDMKYLEAVPREFGGLTALKSISLRACCASTVDSLRDIVEEQQSNGNEELVVRVNWLDYKIGGV